MALAVSSWTSCCWAGCLSLSVLSNILPMWKLLCDTLWVSSPVRSMISTELDDACSEGSRPDEGHFFDDAGFTCEEEGADFEDAEIAPASCLSVAGKFDGLDDGLKIWLDGDWKSPPPLKNAD
jgi:hypothetical protein